MRPMLIRYIGKQRFVFLLVIVGLMIVGGGAWASHECCGHPSDSSRAVESGTHGTSSDGDCACACCQAETAISPRPGISFHFDSSWSIENLAVFAVSRFETDIFRPPLA